MGDHLLGDCKYAQDGKICEFKMAPMTTIEVMAQVAWIIARRLPGASLAAEITDSILSGNKTIDESQNDPVKDEQAIVREQARTTLTFQQAQVARELAIARRIDTAEEVEIEEFFDVSGKGQMGVQTQESGLSVGLSGEGKKLSRRIYRFKGWRDGGLETLMADLGGLTPEELEDLRKLIQLDSASPIAEEVHEGEPAPADRSDEA